jgi:hypothetical protein
VGPARDFERGETIRARPRDNFGQAALTQTIGEKTDVHGKNWKLEIGNWKTLRSNF